MHPCLSLALEKGRALPLKNSQGMLFRVHDPVCDKMLMSPSVIRVNVLFHSVESVGMILEISLCVGCWCLFKHLIEFLVFLMQLLLLIAFHSHTEGIQCDKSLLTLNALINEFVFPLKYHAIILLH